jgi:hypothetical protein
MKFSHFLTFSLASAAVLDTSKVAQSLKKRLDTANYIPPVAAPEDLWTDSVNRVEQWKEAPPAVKPPPASSKPASKPPPPASSKPASKPPPPATTKSVSQRPSPTPTKPVSQTPKNKPSPTPTKSVSQTPKNSPPPKKCKRADPACTGPDRPKSPGLPKGFKQHEGSNHVFLDIDAPSVGFMLASGKYEVLYKGRETIRGQTDAQTAGMRKIGTDTLAPCTAVFLVSRGGTIGSHLPPDACELFLASSKKQLDQARKKTLKDQLTPDNYKKWKKAMEKISDTGKRMLRENSAAMSGYTTYIVKGNWAPNDDWGNMMAADIFGEDHMSAVKWAQDRKSQKSGLQLIKKLTFDRGRCWKTSHGRLYNCSASIAQQRPNEEYLGSDNWGGYRNSWPVGQFRLSLMQKNYILNQYFRACARN